MPETLCPVNVRARQLHVGRVDWISTVQQNPLKMPEILCSAKARAATCWLCQLKALRRIIVSYRTFTKCLRPHVLWRWEQQPAGWSKSLRRIIFYRITESSQNAWDPVFSESESRNMLVASIERSQAHYCIVQPNPLKMPEIPCSVKVRAATCWLGQLRDLRPIIVPYSRLISNVWDRQNSARKGE